MLHLGQTDGASAPARRHLHQWAILGRSTHAPAQTDAAIKDPDVDYFCAGPVYATSTKPDYEPVGLDLVRYAAKVAPVGRIDAKPWFAIGGISPDNLDEVIEAGARRVCVVRAITEASDPQAAADRLQTRLRAAWKADPTMERYIFQACREPARAVSSRDESVGYALASRRRARAAPVQASRRTAASASEVRPAGLVGHVHFVQGFQRPLVDPR